MIGIKRLGWAETSMALIAIVLAAGCDYDLTWTFSVSEKTPEIPVPGDPTGGVLSGVSSSVEMGVRHQPDFEEQGFDYIERAVVAGIVLEIADSSTDPNADPLEDGMPDGFGFIDSAELYIEAEIDGVLRRELVAYTSGAARGGSFLELETTGVNVVEFVEAPGGYVVTTEAVGTLPPDKVIFTGSVTYEVTVGLSM